jgi:hypothetical protein
MKFGSFWRGWFFLALYCCCVAGSIFKLLTEAQLQGLQLFRAGSDWESLLLGGTTGAAVSVGVKEHGFGREGVGWGGVGCGK